VQPGPLYDIGCGPGTLLAAAAGVGRATVGIDVSLEWLVVAQRLIRAMGGAPVLACALAEKLPLDDGTVQSAAVLDVIEHVSDQGAVVRELNRVLAPSGTVALATPNRFSLAAEPHVGVWGVGWVPAAYQERYVHWRSGKSYDFVRLLSRRELVRLFERHSEIDIRVAPATVSAHELRDFTHRRARVASVYNRLASGHVSKRLISPISPFFHLVGSRR
jgi:SAM-dependent methyltransferase